MGRGEGRGEGRGAAMFGGLTVCTFICLLTVGFPILLTGVMLVAYRRQEIGSYVCGIILIVMAVIMLMLGTIACIATFVCAKKAVSSFPTTVVPQHIIFTSAGRSSMGFLTPMSMSANVQVLVRQRTNVGQTPESAPNQQSYPQPPPYQQNHPEPAPQQPAAYQQPQQPAPYQHLQQPAPYQQHQQPASYQQPQQPGAYQQPQQPAAYQQPQQSAAYQQPQQPAPYQQSQQPAAPQQPADTAVPVSGLYGSEQCERAPRPAVYVSASREYSVPPPPYNSVVQ